MKAKYRDWAFLEQRSGRGAEKKLAQDWLPVCPHHQQASVHGLNLLQYLNVGRVYGFDDMGCSLDAVTFQELNRMIGAVGRIAAVLVDGNDVNIGEAGQAGRLKRQERARGLQAAIVRDHDRFGVAERVGYGDDGPGASCSTLLTGSPGSPVQS
jgi:hypothetical protein